MDKQEKLFCKWINLKEEIQMMAAIVQNPLDQSRIASADLTEWKIQCTNFENIYIHLKQNTEEFIVGYLNGKD